MGDTADGKKKKGQAVGRHAEQGGQAVNVDLCFVPWEHCTEGWLPAVSGSSGHLVVERQAEGSQERHWPGQIFEQAELSFVEAMQCYALLTQDRQLRQKQAPRLPEQAPTPWRQEWEARAERHEVVQCRRQEDADWLADRQEHHRIVDTYRALTRKQRAQQAAEWQAQKAHWAQREQERVAVLTQRKSEDQAWHDDKRVRWHTAKAVWIAILVVTDNATRQCLGLPVFASGAHVTTQEVTDALRTLLPEELAFLISDQGKHFLSKALAQLAQVAHFVHIPVYRHRPQSNGIAERFVRTLKQELRHCNWSGPTQLIALLCEIRPAYNDRPHQGLPIPGLSPNEFANRIWLM
jgi:transposase InsO family protein